MSFQSSIEPLQYRSSCALYIHKINNIDILFSNKQVVKREITMTQTIAIGKRCKNFQQFCLALHILLCCVFSVRYGFTGASFIGSFCWGYAPPASSKEQSKIRQKLHTVLGKSHKTFLKVGTDSQQGLENNSYVGASDRNNINTMPKMETADHVKLVFGRSDYYILLFTFRFKYDYSVYSIDSNRTYYKNALVLCD